MSCPSTKPTTQLSVTSSNSQAYVGQSADITEKLTSNGNALPNETITLIRGKSPQVLSTTTTDSSGGFAFQVHEPSSGSYTYNPSFLGDVMYLEATGFASVQFIKTPTTLTGNATPWHANVGQNITFSGILSANGAGIAGKPVVFYNADTKAWTRLATTTTGPSGAYQFTWTENSAGAHLYAAGFPAIMSMRSQTVRQFT